MATKNPDEKYCADIIETIYMGVNYLPNHRINKQIQSESSDNKNNTNTWFNFDDTCAHQIEKTRANLKEKNITLVNDKILNSRMNYFVQYDVQSKTVELGIANYIGRTWGKILGQNPIGNYDVFYHNWFN